MLTTSDLKPEVLVAPFNRGKKLEDFCEDLSTVGKDGMQQVHAISSLWSEIRTVGGLGQERGEPGSHTQLQCVNIQRSTRALRLDSHTRDWSPPARCVKSLEQPSLRGLGFQAIKLLLQKAKFIQSGIRTHKFYSAVRTGPPYF